jgi:hypothetical protein
MSELKDCPFCGAKEPIVHLREDRIDKEIICDLGKGGCGARVGWYVSIIEVRNAWNQRVKRVER